MKTILQQQMLNHCQGKYFCSVRLVKSLLLNKFIPPVVKTKLQVHCQDRNHFTKFTQIGSLHLKKLYFPGTCRLQNKKNSRFRDTLNLSTDAKFSHAQQTYPKSMQKYKKVFKKNLYKKFNQNYLKNSTKVIKTTLK